MYHGDLTDKLKILYKLHLPPGECLLPYTATSEHGLFRHAIEKSFADEMGNATVQLP